jgi:hypothetical protein
MILVYRGGEKLGRADRLIKWRGDVKHPLSMNFAVIYQL